MSTISIEVELHKEEYNGKYTLYSSLTDEIDLYAVASKKDSTIYNKFKTNNKPVLLGDYYKTDEGIFYEGTLVHSTVKDGRAYVLHQGGDRLLIQANTVTKGSKNKVMLISKGNASRLMFNCAYISKMRAAPGELDVMITSPQGASDAVYISDLYHLAEQFAPQREYEWQVHQRFFPDWYEREPVGYSDLAKLQSKGFKCYSL